MLETLVVATILLAVIAFIIALFSPNRVQNTETRQKKRKKSKTQGNRSGFCPVCNSDLFGIEKVSSIVFETQNTSDRRCHITGCPHCHPIPDSLSIKRECPVCLQTLPQNEYLITRMFDRGTRKQHVHVVGCSICHKKAKKN